MTFGKKCFVVRGRWGQRSEVTGTSNTKVGICYLQLLLSSKQEKLYRMVFVVFLLGKTIECFNPGWTQR